MRSSWTCRIVWTTSPADGQRPVWGWERADRSASGPSCSTVVATGSPGHLLRWGALTDAPHGTGGSADIHPRPGHQRLSDKPADDLRCGGHEDVDQIATQESGGPS